MGDRVRLTVENTHIVDSYLVRSKEEMRAFLSEIREHCAPEMAVAHRSLSSLISEWRAHNLFYYLHVFRTRTKDVDLERQQPWWRECFCRVISFFYFW